MCNQPPTAHNEYSDSRTFGQLPDLHVPEDFDEPLTDAENAVWEADSAD
jgi:hypothetical protein